MQSLIPQGLLPAGWPPWIPLAVIGLALVLAFVTGVAVARALRRARVRRTLAHGRRMEQKAPRILERAGYTVEAIHPVRRYTWFVDGEPRVVKLEADLLARKRGRLWLVEVKTGQSASPDRIPTRRQLLEYSLHFNVDGLLLLDADRSTLTEVEFPDTVRRSWRGSALWLVLGAAISWAILRAPWVQWLD